MKANFGLDIVIVTCILTSIMLFPIALTSMPDVTIIELSGKNPIITILSHVFLFSGAMTILILFSFLLLKQNRDWE